MSEGNGLPKGWAEASIDDISDVVRGISFPTNAKHLTPQKGDIACLRTANVQAEVEWDDLWYVSETYVGRDEQFVQEDDILISTANSYELVGKVARVRTVPMRSSLGAFIALMRCRKAVTPAFLHHQMCSLEVSARLRSMASTTTNISNISTGKLRELVLRIAPLPEQHRIVEKIEELFSDLDAGVASLERAKANLKRYRASVLKSAVEGRLTEEWRKEHSRAEDGEMLLDRILLERREKWEKEQLQKFTEKGTEPPKNWQSKYEEPSAPDTSDVPELPEGWVWATADQLSDSVRTITYGVVKLGDPVSDGVPTLRSSNVRPLFLELDEVKRISPRIASEYQRTFLVGGELLFTIRGTLGGIVVAPNECRGWNVSREVAVLALMEPEVGKALAVFVASSPLQNWLARHTRGIAYTGINLVTLKDLPIPLPPLAEQKQIVALVEERLSQIDSAQKTIDAELIRAKRLRHSILKRAFEGKLVPQDPKDEPASVLMERIKASRETELPQKKAKKVKAT
jgi:type I restriction enzyme S subunit